MGAFSCLEQLVLVLPWMSSPRSHIKRRRELVPPRQVVPPGYPSTSLNPMPFTQIGTMG